MNLRDPIVRFRSKRGVIATPTPSWYSSRYSLTQFPHNQKCWTEWVFAGRPPSMGRLGKRNSLPSRWSKVAPQLGLAHFDTIGIPPNPGTRLDENLPPWAYCFSNRSAKLFRASVTRPTSLLLMNDVSKQNNQVFN